MKLLSSNVSLEVQLYIFDYFLVDLKFRNGTLAVIQQDIINRMILEIFEHLFKKLQTIGFLDDLFLSQLFDPLKSGRILLKFCKLTLGLSIVLSKRNSLTSCDGFRILLIKSRII